jgi:mannose-6-phosphate isomerase-like protein (cupin superfamily)
LPIGLLEKEGHWIVAQGSALVEKDGRHELVSENQST